MPDDLWYPALPAPKPDEPISYEEWQRREAGRQRALREAEENIARILRGDWAPG